MKPFRFIFSPVFMTILFFLFVLSMATATFIGNDFGHETAYETVYNTKWFELIMLLLALNLAGQIFQHRLWRKEKITVMGFHMAFVIMFAGAGITRYNGYEGTMRIKEGEEENRVFSAEKYISYILKDKEGKILSQQYKKFSPASFSRVKYEWKVDGSLILRLAQIIPNAIESIEGSPSGSPVISFMISYPGHGIKNLVMKEGDTATVEGYSICFVPGIKSDISIMADSTGFYLITSLNAFAGGMMQEEKTAYQPGERILLSKMQVINIGNIRIVPRDFMLKGIITPIPADEEAAETGRNAFTFQIFEQDKTYMLTLWDNPEDYYSSLPLEINGKTLEVSYGSRIINLPFSIKLNDFILERYPGSNTPSAYKSDIVLNDYNDGVSKQFLIYMNNVLKYKGYRFYQASYESDEKGTILSVNHDMAGIMVTYTGYSILFIFIILSLLNRNSLFRKANINYWHSPFSKKLSSLAILFVLSGFTGVMAQKQQFIPDKDVADEFGHVLVQNQKGRTEPLYTISSDILRKVTRKNRFGGLTSMQVFLGIYFDFQNWQNIPLIRISSRKLSEKIGINGRMAAFSDIVDFNRNGYYKLAGYVETAYSKRPAERSKFDREVIKTDERINIIYMIYTGEFIRIFPLKDSHSTWGNPEKAIENAVTREDSLYLRSIFPALYQASSTGNLPQARFIAQSMLEYQRRFADYELPSKSKINAEIFFIKVRFFERLFPFYAAIGIIMLTVLIASLIRGKGEDRLFKRFSFWLLFTGFIIHTTAFAIRWYISGHVPLSNGYESMIFISWMTIIAGLIFSRKSVFVLPSTALLSAMTLLVAHMSFMDPEITNLVPVLKSYWLTFHVSVITSSYAFLGLGTLIGLMVMLLFILSGRRNVRQAGKAINELTVLNYRTLIIGLYLLTIGTFLGAVWANESWGRYWGWDPKETWSLITIVIYSFVIHSWMIPSLRNIYAFNLLSLFAFSSVLMTYFGVNYYLSGLHSYAGGDPVPVPAFIYVTAAIITLLVILSYVKYKKWDSQNKVIKG